MRKTVRRKNGMREITVGKMALHAWKKVKAEAMKREAGIDGILVTVGLCIIALLLCVVMKDSLTGFIQTIVTAMQNKANGILTGV